MSEHCVRLSLRVTVFAMITTIVLLIIIGAGFLPLILDGDKDACSVTVLAILLLLLIWLVCIRRDVRNGVWGNEEVLWVKENNSTTSVKWDAIDFYFTTVSLVRTVVLVCCVNGEKKYIPIVYNANTKELIQRSLDRNNIRRLNIWE